METTPLSTALTTFLSDPANAKAMMKTLVAAACNSSADNAGATALGGNYVHLLVDKSTGDIKFRSEADDASVASGIGWKYVPSGQAGDVITIEPNDWENIVFVDIKRVGSALLRAWYSNTFKADIVVGSFTQYVTVTSSIRAITLTLTKSLPTGGLRYKVLS